MSGQPSKRRKLSKEKKPRGEVRDVIADALQVPYIFLPTVHSDVSEIYTLSVLFSPFSVFSVCA